MLYYANIFTLRHYRKVVYIYILIHYRTITAKFSLIIHLILNHTGKLVLKIPWKNLYGASVEASVERLFLVVNPTAEVKYDAEKEEKMALASKQAELARVEEAKRQEAQMGQYFFYIAYNMSHLRGKGLPFLLQTLLCTMFASRR